MSEEQPTAPQMVLRGLVSETVQTLPAEPVIPDQGQCFIVRASTGCSCCRDVNFVEGPWRTREAAVARTQSLKSYKRLSSQYSDTGEYSVIEVKYERAGKWIILDEKYAIGRPFIEDDEDSFDYEIDAYKKDYHL